MQISRIIELLNAKLLCGDADADISTAFSSDTMSDVLASPEEIDVLLTGLVNPQVVRTADMLDIPLIIFVRGKAPSGDMIRMAEECGITMIVTNQKMFVACGTLYEAGLNRKETA